MNRRELVLYAVAAALLIWLWLASVPTLPAGKSPIRRRVLGSTGPSGFGGPA